MALACSFTTSSSVAKGLAYFVVGENDELSGGVAKYITDESWEIIREGSLGYVISYGDDLDRIIKIVDENKIFILVKICSN